VAGGDDECGGDVVWWLVRERQSLDILPVKKEAKLSASEVPGEVVGSGLEDLRCSSLLTVRQRRLELSEAEDTRVVSNDESGTGSRNMAAQQRIFN